MGENQHHFTAITSSN